MAISQIILVQFSTRLVVGDAGSTVCVLPVLALTQLSGKYQNRSVTSGRSRTANQEGASAVYDASTGPCVGQDIHSLVRYIHRGMKRWNNRIKT